MKIVLASALFALLAACSVTSESTTSDESAVAVDTSCSGLVDVHHDWSGDQLHAACLGASGGCVVTLANTHRDWTADQLNLACKGTTTNCAGLASVHGEWTAETIHAACDRADGSCVTHVANAHRDWTSSQLNTACASAHGDCGGMVDIHETWGPEQIAAACDGVRASCAVHAAAMNRGLDADGINHACR